MNAKTIAVDLAKDVFEVAGSVRPGRISTRCRLSREPFARHIRQQPSSLIVMEACGSARSREITRKAGYTTATDLHEWASKLGVWRYLGEESVYAC